MQNVVVYVRVFLIFLLVAAQSAIAAPNRATDEAVIGSGIIGSNKSLNGRNPLSGLDKVKEKLLNGNSSYNHSGQNTIIVRTRPRRAAAAFRAVSKYSNPCNEPRIKRVLRACPTCSCSPNYEVRALVTPNDTSYNLLWGMPAINAPTAWDVTTGSDSVVIGVIDTGVDYLHPDLADNIWTNPNEIAANGIDDDGNGVIDDIHGINTIPATSSGDPMDDHNHGTHCSGTIAGRGNNNLGVAGVAWRTKIIGAKFLNSSGSGSISDAIQALDYLNDLKLNYGINIVASSNSWGGGGYSQPFLDEVNRSRDAGILFIAAAGNSAQDLNVSPSYPASYVATNIVAVAALTNAGALAGFSNYGNTVVHIGAPGVNIYSTTRSNTYGYMSGTSMATPHVSGVVALLAAAFPSSTMAERKTALINGALSVTALNGHIIGGKTLEAFGALGQLGTPSPTATATATATATFTKTPTAIPTQTPTFSPTAVPTSTPTLAPTPEPTPTVPNESELTLRISPSPLRAGRNFSVSMQGALESKMLSLSLGKRVCGEITISANSRASGKLPRRLTRIMNRLSVSHLKTDGSTVRASRLISGANALAVSYKRACGDLMSSIGTR